VLATLGLGACSSVGEGPQGPVDNGTGNATGDGDSTGDGTPGTGTPGTGTPGTGTPGTGTPGSGDPAAVPCATATKDAYAALDTYCSDCHGPDSAGKGGFRTVLDVKAMIADGKIVPDDAEKSAIYARMKNSSMPPQEVAKRPGAADINAVKSWIACGAPEQTAPGAAALAFTDINTRLRAILDDVRSFENPTDRLRMRYIDLSNYANAGYSEKQVDTYRQALSFAINSTSKGRNVVQPEAIDQQKLLFRIDLRDYGWDAQTWNNFEVIYPYTVIYDEDSRLFPFDEVSAEQVRKETGTQVPYLQGEWFIAHAIRPPIYFQTLGLPDNFGDFQKLLGIDVQNDIDTEQVVRAGTANAGPSQNNRVVEYHALNGNQGQFWLSYDFKDNLGFSNIFTHPLDFQQAGGEAIFTLDNGLQGYYILNAAGDRFDKAPNNVVQDGLARDGAVECGESCVNCHAETGMLPKYDEVRDFVLSTGDNAADIEKVLALYGDRNTLQSLYEEGSNIYKTSLAAAGVTSIGATTMHSLDNVFLDVMHINDVAGAMGLTTEDFERAIDASPQAFPPEIITLREANGAINRDSFEAAIDGIILGLGLGQKNQVRPLNGN